MRVSLTVVLATMVLSAAAYPFEPRVHAQQGGVQHLVAHQRRDGPPPAQPEHPPEQPPQHPPEQPPQHPQEQPPQHPPEQPPQHPPEQPPQHPPEQPPQHSPEQLIPPPSQQSPSPPPQNPPQQLAPPPPQNEPQQPPQNAPQQPPQSPPGSSPPNNANQQLSPAGNQHFEHVEHPGGNPNNIDRVTQNTFNDPQKGIHNTVVSHVTVANNNVKAGGRSVVIEGSKGPVSNGKNNVILPEGFWRRLGPKGTTFETGHGELPGANFPKDLRWSGV
ncbi:hypothetical protein GGI25_000262 [Coemansia spiralis]|uniref:Uncharacterized protein n=1 Tax=Coemansia spiralis TaxID=417178 RepID=A0A9W8G7U9_9FUNG|nr:hypothetical protein GGI26_000297 [Coemansia sp. RSA 1358]KAJ2680956.1 hypothetical protein GGI25_000262 [Coemansia spiralis]